MAEEYVGGFPALQICGAFGSITVRGSTVEVERTLRDMQASNSPVVKRAFDAIEKNVNDLASGAVGGGESTKTSTKPAYAGGGGSKYPEKRQHPEGKTCKHNEVVVEQHNSKSGEGYWVCGQSKKYGGFEDCSSKDSSNINKP